MKTWIKRGLIPLCAMIAALGCDSAEEKSSNGNGCLTTNACCALAQDQGVDNPENGAEDCEGQDLGGEEWCDAAAELAKQALNATNIEGQCVLGLKADTVTRVPIIWVNSTNEQKVALFDSATGQEILRAKTWGRLSNRTAVASDGSVWITNRDSYHYIHIGLDGNVLCASEYGPQTSPEEGTGYARAAAIDADGNAWIGFYNEKQAVKVSGNETDGTVMVVDPNDPMITEEVPKCKELARLQMETTSPYGLVADGDGMVWAGTLGSGTIAKIDAREEKVLGEYTITEQPAWQGLLMKLQEAGVSTGLSLYGMAIDFDGNPWFGNTSGGFAVKLDKDTADVLLLAHSPDQTAMDKLTNARSLGIDQRGHIWIADNYTRFVHEFLPDGTYVQAVDTTCPDGAVPSGLLGIGSDIDGDMWVVSQNLGRAVKIKIANDPMAMSDTVEGCFPLQPEQPDATNPLLSSPYTYSDLTGSTNALVTSQLGRWRAVVERETAIQWAAVAYEANTPDGTSVCVRVRAADDKTALQTAPWSGSLCMGIEAGPYTLHKLVDENYTVVGKTKFLEVELQLNSANSTQTPSVKSFSVAGLTD
ncbi:MAG: hypothetical protein KC416_09115 [Myxococcales bacterium]|nr:hypothetical protein [Myxococcales bacterium]